MYVIKNLNFCIVPISVNLQILTNLFSIIHLYKANLKYIKNNKYYPEHGNAFKLSREIKICPFY